MGDEIADGTEQSLFELEQFSHWVVAMTVVAFITWMSAFHLFLG